VRVRSRPEVRHCGHVDTHVVAGDDALGLDRHGDDAQRKAVQDVDERDDDSQPRLARPQHSTQPEQHALLVLFDDSNCQRRSYQQQYGDDDYNSEQDLHGFAPNQLEEKWELLS